MELRDVAARDEYACADGLLAEAGGQMFGMAALPAASSPGSGIFLHTGWRSGGTWIWSRCRASSRVCGYYEPLHEQAARFRRRDVARMRPGSWQSNHSDTPPYFEEFRDLIPPHGRGVARYEARFAFDGFFKGPDDPPDAALETYLGRLVAGAKARGKVPVLKFCRSMGRVGWLETLFPQALHLVVLRDPLAQYHSIQRLLDQQRNRYFALAPMLVLARNAHHPAVREATRCLGVTLPPLYSDDMDYAVETSWRHVRLLSAAEQYRGFLAFWTLSAIAGLDSDAAIIDMDRLGSHAAHRAAVEQALGARIGEGIRLVPRAAGLAAAEAMRPPGMAEAHAAALRLLQAHRCGLAPDRHDLIAAKLDAEFGPHGSALLVPGWSSPAPVPKPRPGLRRLLGTGAMVLAARAIQPLRRLHGAMVWRTATWR